MAQTSTYPWDQLPDETEKAYAAFLAFRDLGVGRSLEQAWYVYQERTAKPKAATKSKSKKKQKEAKGSTRPGSSFYGWASGHQWWERAKAWDYYTSRLVNMRFLAKRERLLESQFEELDKIVELCVNSIDRWLRQQRGKSSNIKGLTPFVAMQGIQAARKVQFEQLNALAKAQAEADAQMMGDIEDELEFFDPDDFGMEEEL